MGHEPVENRCSQSEATGGIGVVGLFIPGSIYGVCKVCKTEELLCNGPIAVGTTDRGYASIFAIMRNIWCPMTVLIRHSPYSSLFRNYADALQKLKHLNLTRQF